MYENHRTQEVRNIAQTAIRSITQLVEMMSGAQEARAPSQQSTTPATATSRPRPSSISQAQPSPAMAASTQEQLGLQ